MGIKRCTTRQYAIPRWTAVLARVAPLSDERSNGSQAQQGNPAGDRSPTLVAPASTPSSPQHSPAVPKHIHPIVSFVHTSAHTKKPASTLPPLLHLDALGFIARHSRRAGPIIRYLAGQGRNHGTTSIDTMTRAHTHHTKPAYDSASPFSTYSRCC